jgi:putative ABC transport system permease protein
MPDLDALRQDLRYAIRALARQPAFALAAILTLGLGIGVNTAVFTVVNALLLRPLPFHDPDRLVFVQTRVGGEAGKVAMREFKALMLDGTIFDDVAAYYRSQYNVTGSGRPESIPTTISTHNILHVLGLHPVIGSSWPSTHDFTRQYTVMVGHGLWRRRFGSDPAIVGKKIRLDAADYEVVGVAPPGADFPDRAEAFRSITDYNAEDQRRLSVVGRLKRGVSLVQARDALAAFGTEMAARYPASNTGVTFEAELLREAHVGVARPYLWLLLGVVTIVLVIACANVGNLLLSRAVDRQAELAVREALGATRRRLTRQMVTETMVLAALGGAAGLALLAVTLRLIVDVIQPQLPIWMTIQVDARVIAFTFVVIVLTGLLAGTVPALRVSDTGPAHALSGSGKGAVGRTHRRFRQAFTVAQIAMALPLLVGACLMIQSFWGLQSTDLGFRPTGLLTFRVDPPYGKYSDIETTSWFYRRALDELRAVPGVTGAATNQDLPIARLPDAVSRTVFVEGQAIARDGEQPFVTVQAISPRYFDVMKIPLRGGRDFSEHDRESSMPVAIVNERLARRSWPGQDPIGKRLRLEGTVSTLAKPTTKPMDHATVITDAPWLTVIGVVSDVKHEHVMRPEGLDVYVPHTQFFSGDAYFVVRTSQSPASLMTAVTQAVWRVDPDQSVFAIRPMDARVNDTIWQQRLSGRLFGLFAGLALTLAVIGVYGVMSHLVARRTRELGVRMALGASRTDLLRLVLGESARITLAGCAVGIAGALILARALAHLLHGVPPYNVIVVAGTAVTLALTALGAAYLPARRAAAVNPIVALRE